MSPERKKGPSIMIAIGHPKKPPQGPPPEPGGGLKAAAAAAPAPKTKEAPAPDTDLDEEAGGTSQAIRPEDVDYRTGELCSDCKYMADSGNCDRYKFPVQPTGHCLDGYEPKEGAGEEEEAGGPAAGGIGEEEEGGEL